MLSFSSVSTACLRCRQHFWRDPRDTCVLPDIELLARDGGVDERRWCCWTIRGGVRLRLSLGFNRCFAVGEICWFGIFTLIPSYSDCETFCAYLDIYRRFLTCNVWFFVNPHLVDFCKFCSPSWKCWNWQKWRQNFNNLPSQDIFSHIQCGANIFTKIHIVHSMAFSLYKFNAKTNFTCILMKKIFGYRWFCSVWHWVNQCALCWL